MAQPVVRLNPGSLPDAGAIGYSQISIVEPGRLAFVSGQVARRPSGEPTPSGLAAQAGIACANAKRALDAIGAAPADMVMVRIYVVNLTPERLEETMPVILDFFGGVHPSVTGIGVAALAEPDLQIEIEMIVRVPN